MLRSRAIMASTQPGVGLLGLLLSLLLGVLLPSRALAGADEAWLGVDLESGTVRATSEGHELGFVADAAGLRARLIDLVEAFARGEDPHTERVELGRLLLGPLAPVLATAPRWRVQQLSAGTAPGPLAALPALVLPWDREKRAVAARHAISFAWPRPLSDLAGLPRSPAASAAHGLLLVAPFERGVQPVSDDPDTLRRALRGAVAQVDLLPRNEISAAAVRRALEDSAAPVLWLRATPRQIPPLRPSFGALPTLVVWSLPSRDPRARAELSPSTFASGGVAPAALIVQVWPASEAALGAAYRDLADALAQGRSAGQSVADLQRTAALAGAAPAGWAAFAVLGDATTVVEIERAPWLRRWFSRP